MNYSRLIFIVRSEGIATQIYLPIEYKPQCALYFASLIELIVLIVLIVLLVLLLVLMCCCLA